VGTVSIGAIKNYIDMGMTAQEILEAFESNPNVTLSAIEQVIEYYKDL
jgi:uncharacterized protein (DUF433 family)